MPLQYLSKTRAVNHLCFLSDVIDPNQAYQIRFCLDSNSMSQLSEGIELSTYCGNKSLFEIKTPLPPQLEANSALLIDSANEVIAETRIYIN